MKRQVENETNGTDFNKISNVDIHHWDFGWMWIIRNPLKPFKNTNPTGMYFFQVNSDLEQINGGW